jgi:CHASE3 domain sensor protein
VTDDPTPTDARILATLEQILRVQSEMLSELRQAGDSATAVTAESLSLQRQAAERSALAVETQRKAAQLYRRVVTVVGIVVLGTFGFAAYVLTHG